MKPQGIRWWPALLILVAGGVALWIMRAIPELQRQDRLVGSAIAVLSTLFLLLLWAILFSRMRWKARAAVLLLVLLGLGVLASNFEIRGVTGDLVPIVDFRWREKPVLAPPVTGGEKGPEATTNSALAGLSFPQFLGPQRNGVLLDAQLDPHWKAHPPKLLWKQPVGAAWSGFVIHDGLAITQEQRGEKEFVVCYNLLTGQPAWSHSEEAKYSTTIAGEGPRSTPTISSNKVYALGATGILNCFDLSSGKVVWSKNLPQEHNAKVPEWGYVSAPLVHNGRVYLVGGGNNRALVCYDAESGNFLWGAGDGSVQYSSPVFFELAKVPQIVTFQQKLWGCSLEGKPLWTHPWKGNQPRVSLPVAAGPDRLLVSTGYGVGAELLSFSKDDQGNITPTPVWKSLSLKSKFGVIFIIQDHIYGLDDGIFTCVDLKNGERKWKEGRYGHGQALQVGAHILLTTEQGEVVLIEPNPFELKEVARLKVFDEKTWNPPALAGPYLLLRNHLEAACYQVKTVDPGRAVASN